ncbi:protein of unknown function [Nitrospira defluvii]|uniref:Uncharacterized protein n=1 Tax=Nitrospira defluvii TaxID=330214 RepID=D8PDT8_9BACT|nr:protein of unknown function [Nitrospira defluvii]
MCVEGICIDDRWCWMVLAADSDANRKSGGVTRNQGPLWRGTSERLLDPEGGDASPWPPLCLIVEYRHRE